MTITKDTLIGDILDTDRTTATYFLEMGMHCLGCPSARGETLEQACQVHGVDCEELVKKSTTISPVEARDNKPKPIEGAVRPVPAGGGLCFLHRNARKGGSS